MKYVDWGDCSRIINVSRQAFIFPPFDVFFVCLFVVNSLLCYSKSLILLLLSSWKLISPAPFDYNARNLSLREMIRSQQRSLNLQILTWLTGNRIARAPSALKSSSTCDPRSGHGYIPPCMFNIMLWKKQTTDAVLNSVVNHLLFQ